MFYEVKKIKGFTLVELLVVIAIMSILTVITVSQFETARKKARDVQRKADLSSLEKALEMYYADFGKVPLATVVGGGISLPGATWGGTFEDTSENPPYVYMKVLPKENSTNALPYCYKTTGDGKKFALYTNLENISDKECDHNNDGVLDAVKDTMPCNGQQYCYYILSPNASLAPTTVGMVNRGDLQ